MPEGDYPKTLVVLGGATAPYPLVGPVTGIRYGTHRAGDKLWMHNADVEADPEVFIPYVQASQTLSALPITPEEVRPAGEPPKKRSRKRA